MSTAITADVREEFDPETVRMSVGDHLEELRRRLALGLMGFVPVFAVCLFYGQRVMAAFCRPLVDTLQSCDINPQVYFTEVGDPFLVFIKISMISAAAIASPWLLFQVWLFAAAGLYPHERRVITRYVPLSITLLISGMVFLYFWVLPWTLQFFLAFSVNAPLTLSQAPIDSSPGAVSPTQIAILQGDPPSPQEGQMWFDAVQRRLKMFIGHEIRVIPFGPQNLMAPMITLGEYIDMVVSLLLIFGLCFQLPLVVLALVRVGILEVDTLRRCRRHVYLIICIAATVITPGDVITATLALMVPLALLYELGILLAIWRPGRTDTESD